MAIELSRETVAVLTACANSMYRVLAPTAHEQAWKVAAALREAEDKLANDATNDQRGDAKPSR